MTQIICSLAIYYQLGRSTLETDASNFGHPELEEVPVPQDVFNQANSNANETPPALPHKQWNFEAVATSTSISKYEDTSGLLPPPPLPPKSRKT